MIPDYTTLRQAELQSSLLCSFMKQAQSLRYITSHTGVEGLQNAGQSNQNNVFEMRGF